MQATEVVELLRQIIKEPEKLKAVHAAWDHVYAGDVTFSFDGWTITIFNDCHELDYVARCVAPDGRSGAFKDWPLDGEPVDQLSVEEYNALEAILEAAEVAH